jgi:hypothetical protein
MSHSQDESDKEDLDCIADHVKILSDTLNGINGEVSKAKVIKELRQIKKRVDYMLDDLQSKEKCGQEHYSDSD